MTSGLAVDLLYIAANGLLIFVAGITLVRGGRRLLVDPFGGDASLVASATRLVTAGFVLINLGYLVLVGRGGGSGTDAAAALDQATVKIGGALVVLGLTYLFSVSLLSRFRSRRA
jgi:hypothetical protein